MIIEPWARQLRLSRRSYLMCGAYSSPPSVQSAFRVPSRGMPVLTFEQHTAILRALLSRDQRLSQGLLRAHILQSYAFVRSRALDEEPSG